jgi:hypothetical protein
MKKILLLLTFLVPFISNARKIYVSNSGNDIYTLTQAQNPNTPWATLSKIQSSSSTLVAGDSVLFKRGDKFTGTLLVQSRTKIYFGAYGVGENPLFWGNGSVVSVMFRIRNSVDVVFENLNVSDTTISFSDRTTQAKIQVVFIVESSSSNITIKKIKMERVGNGVYITRTSRGQTIDSCEISNLRMIRNTPTTVNPDDDYGGVPIQISSRNNVVTNNYFHDCWSISYDYGFDGGGIEFFEEGDTIMNNIVAYNTFYDNNGSFEHGSNNDGIANNPIMNNKFYYNKIINCSSLFYINNNGQYKTSVRNLQFYNNVIIQTNSSRTGTTRLGSMAISETNLGIVVFKNNIFQVSNGASVVRSGQWTTGQLIHTNNIYKLSNGSVLNFTQDTSEILTQNVIWDNTTSNNPLDWNYNLTQNSQAINLGVDVGLVRDFIGTRITQRPDAGILERNIVVPTPCNFTYGPWTTCVNGSQTRTYTSSPAGCVGVPPQDSILRNCVSPCSFQYFTWGQCINGIQYRDFTPYPDSCTLNPPTDSIQRSCRNIIITKFYYNPLNTSIYIECNVPGQMRVTNVLGSYARTFNYQSGGQWISVRRFPKGITYASTYGQTITFIR